MGVTGPVPPSSGGEVRFSLDHMAVSREIRSAEEAQSLHFAGGVENMNAHQHAFKGQSQSSWTRALDVLGETHRDLMRPLPPFADKIEDAGIAYHGVDGDNAHGIDSVM